MGCVTACFGYLSKDTVWLGHFICSLMVIMVCSPSPTVVYTSISLRYNVAFNGWSRGIIITWQMCYTKASAAVVSQLTLTEWPRCTALLLFNCIRPVTMRWMINRDTAAHLMRWYLWHACCSQRLPGFKSESNHQWMHTSTITAHTLRADDAHALTDPQAITNLAEQLLYKFWLQSSKHSTALLSCQLQ
jgi:hypothetical protein